MVWLTCGFMKENDVCEFFLKNYVITMMKIVIDDYTINNSNLLMIFTCNLFFHNFYSFSFFEI